jgi:hypothetical protein
LTEYARPEDGHVPDSLDEDTHSEWLPLNYRRNGVVNPKMNHNCLGLRKVRKRDKGRSTETGKEGRDKAPKFGPCH